MRNVFVALVLVLSPAFAGNLTDDAPIAQFKGKDRELFDAALYGTLDTGKDGTSRTWSNAETQAQGDVKAVKSFKRGEAACRTVHISNKAGGRTSAADYDFCKSAAGKWVLAQ